jgi:MinD-like ATPase involved in chromosome partitioning or flagellar assembly
MRSPGAPGPRSGPLSVLVAAAGAAWEAAALEQLERGGGVLVKRCVDLTDLLATATAGLASVAVLSSALPGLDADSVSVLRRGGLSLVVVALPDELLGDEPARLRRLGIEHVLVSTDVDGLSELVLRVSVGPVPVSVPVHTPGSLPQDGAATGGGAGRVLAVWGPTGAPGRTTVAVGIATEIARSGEDVLLVDVDAYGGAVAQHLGVLEEMSGLLAAVRAANTGQLDPPRLAGLARQVDDRLRVLTGLPRADRWQEVRPTAFTEVLEEATHLAGYVLLDVGFSLESGPVDPFGSSAPQRNQMTLAALQRADEVLVVGAADPVGLSRLARGLVELHETLPTARPRVVVNRTRPSLGWTDREIRGMVEGFVRPVDVHFLPDDRAAADRALMSGTSLAESGDSALRSAMRALASAVLGEPVNPPAGRRRSWPRRARDPR